MVLGNLDAREERRIPFAAPQQAGKNWEEHTGQPSPSPIVRSRMCKYIRSDKSAGFAFAWQ